MASLNHGKIVNALENIVKGPREEFIWDFLEAYGTPSATIKRLKLGDRQCTVPVSYILCGMNGAVPSLSRILTW